MVGDTQADGVALTVPDPVGHHDPGAHDRGSGHPANACSASSVANVPHVTDLDGLIDRSHEQTQQACPRACPSDRTDARPPRSRKGRRRSRRRCRWGGQPPSRPGWLRSPHRSRLDGDDVSIAPGEVLTHHCWQLEKCVGGRHGLALPDLADQHPAGPKPIGRRRLRWHGSPRARSGPPRGRLSAPDGRRPEEDRSRTRRHTGG